MARRIGLGGVRKRVKLLGGEVRWRQNGARGIVCEVVVERFTEPPAAVAIRADTPARGDPR